MLKFHLRLKHVNMNQERVKGMANIITLAGLGFSISGIALLKMNWVLSIICLILAGIADLFDGVVARRMKSSENNIGKELDSLVDVVSFGVFPIVILISLTDTLIFSILISIIYTFCAIWRLAVFQSRPYNPKEFIGLPVTYAALILPILFLAKYFLAKSVFDWLFYGIMLALSVLFILPVRIPKPRGKAYIVLSVIAVILITAWGYHLLKG